MDSNKADDLYFFARSLDPAAMKGLVDTIDALNKSHGTPLLSHLRASAIAVLNIQDAWPDETPKALYDTDKDTEVGCLEVLARAGAVWRKEKVEFDKILRRVNSQRDEWSFSKPADPQFRRLKRDELQAFSNVRDQCLVIDIKALEKLCKAADKAYPQRQERTLE